MDQPKKSKSSILKLSDQMGQNLGNANNTIVNRTPKPVRQVVPKPQSTSKKAGQLLQNSPSITPQFNKPANGQSLNDLFQVNAEASVANNMAKIINSYRDGSAQQENIAKAKAKEASLAPGSTRKLTYNKVNTTDRKSGHLQKMYDANYKDHLKTIESDSWYDKSTQLARVSLNSIAYWGLSKLARIGDVPDAVQSLTTLPSKYTLTDLKYTAYSFANEGISYLGTQYAKLGNSPAYEKLVQDNYNTRKKKINLELQANRTREDNAIKNGTYDQENADFWTSNFVSKGVYNAANVANAIAKKVDPDEGMGSSALDYIEKMNSVTTAAFEDALDTSVRKKQAKTFNNASALLMEQHKNESPEALQKRLEVLHKSTFNDDHKVRGILKDSFDDPEDKRTSGEKLFDRKNWNFEGSMESFNANITPNLVQGVADIIVTAAITKGLGAAGNIGSKGAKAFTSGIRNTVVKGVESELVQSAKAGIKSGLKSAPNKIFEKGFTEVQQEVISKYAKRAVDGFNRAKNSPAVTSAVSTTKKGFSTVTDRVNPVKNYFGETIERLKKAQKEFVDTRDAGKPLVPGKSHLKDNVMFATVLAFDESQQIGIDVYNKAVEDKIGKFLSKEDFYSKYTPANPQEGFTGQEIQSIEEDYDLAVENFANEEPELFANIVEESAKAGRLSASTNFLPELVGNTFIMHKYFKSSKMVTREAKTLRNFLTDNIATRTASTLFKEGVLQEMGMNFYAQKKGEAYAEGQGYSLLSDFVNKDLRTKEAFENLISGGLMAGAQGTAMEIYSGAIQNDFRKYGAYRDYMKDMKELSKYTGKDELKNFINLDIDADNIQQYSNKEKAAETKITALETKLANTKDKKEKATIKADIKKVQEDLNVESQKLLMTKINNSIHAGTTDKLIKTLNIMALEEGIDPEDRAKLLNAVSMVEAMEKQYVKHQGMKDSGTIISNRFAHENNTKALEQAKLDQQSAGMTKVTEALERQARIRAEKEGVDKNGKRHGGKYKKIYKEALEDYNNGFKEGTLGTDFNEPGLRDYEAQENHIMDLQSAIDRGESSYQELISDDYQESFETKREFSGKMFELYRDNPEESEKSTKAKAKLIKKYSKDLTVSQRAALEFEAKSKAINLKAALDAFSELKSAANVKEEADKIKEAKKVITDSKKIAENPDPIISTEEKQAAKDLTPANTVSDGVKLTTEDRGAIATRLTELSEKKKLSAEEKAEQKTLQSQELGAANADEFDTLLEGKQETTPQPKQDLDNLEGIDATAEDSQQAIAAAFLASMGLTPDPKFKTGTATNEIPSDSAGKAETINTENDEDDSFSRRSVKETSDSKEKYKNYIDGIIGSIAFERDVPEDQVTAKDVIRYLQEKVGSDKLDQGWNIIEFGYKALRPEDTSTDFNKMYENIFTDHSTMLENLLDTEATDEAPDKQTKPVVPVEKKTVLSPKEVTPSSVGVVTQGDLAEVEAGSVIPVVASVNENDRVQHSGLNLDSKNLLQVYLPKILELNKQFIKFKKILDFKNYDQSKSNKVKLTVKVPENYKELYIYEVGDNPRRPGTNLSKPIVFAAWEAKNGFSNMVESQKRKDPLWVANVPMLGYDSDGDAVMQMNNGDFASKMDILEFPEDMSQEDRSALKQHSNSANMTVRNQSISNNGTEITSAIRFMNSKKGNNAPQKLVSSEPKESFTEKRIMMGTFNKNTNTIQVDGKDVDVINNNLTPFVNSHRNLIIRQVGVNEDGSPRYQAMLVDLKSIGEVHAESVTNSILIYMLGKLDDAMLVDNIPGLKEFKTRLESEGGYKITEHNQLFGYLDGIIKLSPFNAMTKDLTTNQEVIEGFAKFMNKKATSSTDKGNTSHPGQPSIALVNFKIYIAIKPLDGSDINPEDIIVLDPTGLNPEFTKDAKKLVENQQQLIQQLAILKQSLINKPNKINFKKKPTPKDKKFFLYDEKNRKVETFENYDDFKNNNTEIPRPLGSAEVSPGVVENKRDDGTSFTTMYGYYSFMIDSPELVETPKSIKEEKEETGRKENIKEDVKATIEKDSVGDTPEEISEKVAEVVAKIETLTKTVKTLKTLQAPAEQIAALEGKIEALKGNLQELQGEDNSYSKRSITETQVEEIQEINSEMSVNIKGLTLSQQFDIIDNIFHKIASTIGYKKGSSISKAKILSDIRTEITNLIDSTLKTNLESISDLESLGEGYETFIGTIKEKNNTLTNIKDNWELLEAEVLTMLEQKVEIKEVKNTASKLVEEDTLADEDAEQELDPEDLDSEDTVEDDGDVQQREKDYGSSSLEVKGKPSGSAKMKRFLAGIPVMLKDGSLAKGFLDRVKHYDFVELDNMIKVALNSPVEIDSDYKTVIAKLKEIGAKEPWALAVVEKLEDASTSEQARMEFLYNYTGRHALSSKFVEFTQARNGSFTTRIIDANFNDVSKNIRETWKNNIKNQGVLYVNNTEGEYVPDMAMVEKLIKDFIDIRNMGDNIAGDTFVQGLNYIPTAFREALKGLQDDESITIPKEAFKNSYTGFVKSLKSKFPAKVKFALSPKVVITQDSEGNMIFTKDKVNENQVEALSNWLQDVGLNLNAATLVELTSSGLDLGREGKLEFEQLLTDPKSPFVNIMYNLEGIQSRVKEKSPVDFESFSILENFNNRLLPLADVEAKYTTRVITKNFRDNGKLISGLPVGKFATDRIKEIKGDTVKDDNGNTTNVSVKRDELRSLSFNKSSILLDLLHNDSETFGQVFKMHHVAVGSLKKKDSRFTSSSKVTQLTATDLEVSKLAHFFETNNVPNYTNTELKGFGGDTDVRIGNVFLPTMSDKDQMMVLQTIIFNLKETDYVNGQLSERFLDLLYTQLVKPDLLRIQNYHLNGRTTDIRDYDNAAQLFNLIPSLNTLKTKNGENITYAMKKDPTTFSEEHIDGEFGTQIKSELNAFINSLVQDKLREWEKLSVTTKSNIKVNSNYLNTRTEDNKDYNKRNTNVAAEFIINNLITNANMHMAVIGDPALYSKSKTFNDKNFMTETKEDGLGGSYQVPDVTRPNPNKDANALYREWSETHLGTNLGKRLALLLAPGNKIFNSKNEKYKQINLSDFVDISGNLVDTVVTAYGEDAREELTEAVRGIKAANEVLSSNESTEQDLKEATDFKNKTIKAIYEKYPATADYLDIESTDAQEYTTVKEHLHVMRGQGRIDDEIMAIIEKKLTAQAQDLAKGNPINKNNYLTKDELGFVMQPIKPVYTGQVYDPEQDVMRTVYIKTSSYPLLPQLTAGTQLDGLRTAMENYEGKIEQSEDGSFTRNVRASYITGNKVGGSKNAISPFLPNGDFNSKEFTPENIDAASLTLDRNNFRIQQDVPFKSDKGKEDLISYGTQMLKLLFSNDVINVKTGFKNPNLGKGFADETISGKELLNIFNETFQDLVLIKKKQLYKEIGLNPEGGGSTEVEFRKKVEKLLIKEGLKRNYNKNELDSVKLNENGEFSLPLFLNGQSSKIETLLLSIITKRVVKHKLPGYSYIGASDAGFKFDKTDDASLVEGANRIVYLEEFEKGTGELTGMTTKDGGIKFAQIMVPSKFRNNDGKLLDLYAKNEAGEYIYLNISKSGRYTLKPNMVEEILTNLPTFRIPSSSHVSLSQTQIVGFLPPESGDIIVVPKNFTKQKGMDFDVDKENTYHLWTYVNPNGMVRELSQERINYLVGLMERRNDRKLKKLENTLTSKKEEQDYESEMSAALGSVTAFKELDEMSDNFNSMLESFQDSMAQKLLENRVVKIHSSVLSNSNPEVQKKITKVLSMDFATSQAEKISALKEIGNKNNYLVGLEMSQQDKDKAYSEENRHFSILSDSYQTKKMFLGSAGQSGIGVYSNFLTMSSLMQQYGVKGDFALQVKDAGNLNFMIDGMTVDGVLGSMRTLDGSRSISEVFEELQNTATDNEKEQIMGRTGINTHTIGIFSLMSALGIDKTTVTYDVASKFNIQGKDNTSSDIQMSLGNLMLSQDIVKKFTDMLENKKSNTTDTDTRRPEDILKVMMDDIYADMQEAGMDTSLIDNDSLDFNSITGDNLVENITNTSPNKLMVDYQVLSFMSLMMNYADPVRNLQKVLNMSSNGLGLDLVESNNNLEILKDVVTTKDNPISGVRQLLFESGSGPVDDPANSKNFIFIDKLGYVRPTTPIGSSILNAFNIIEKSWEKFYPYTSKEYAQTINYIIKNTQTKGRGEGRLKLERKVNKDLKKFLFAESRLFTGELRAERDNLFFDVPGENESLASYLKRVTQDQQAITDVIKELRDNPLVRKFTYDINKNDRKNLKNRRPSTIVYNIANSSQENEESIQRALVELIEKNQPLEPRNGQPYTTRDLAQELILSSYLEGGVQEIRQFIKYIPVTYLEVMGFSQDMRDNYREVGNILKLDRDANRNPISSPFIRQFFQHNPDLLPEVKTINGIDLGTLRTSGALDITNNDSFDFNGPESETFGDFLVIKNRSGKGRPTSVIFERQGRSSIFTKIETLGFSGMSEYSPGVKKVEGLKNLNDYSKFGKSAAQKVIQAKSSRVSYETVDFGIRNDGSVTEVVRNIVNSDTEASKVLELFAGFFTDDIKLKVVPESEDRGANGMYRASTNTITISEVTLATGNAEHIAMIMAKELVHAATMNQVKQYVNKSGQYIVPAETVPIHVRKLVTMYQELKTQGLNFSVDEGGPTLGEFIESYKFRETDVMVGSQEDTFYGMLNVDEFMEMALTSPIFRNYMDAIASSKGQRSFIERLKDILKKVLNVVALQNNKTVSQEVVETVHDIIFKENSLVRSPTITESSENESFSMRRPEIEDKILEIERLINNNKLTLETSITEDPFKC